MKKTPIVLPFLALYKMTVGGRGRERRRDKGKEHFAASTSYTLTFIK